MRKSQVSSQVFMYLAGAIIIGVIMVVGYGAVHTIIENGNNAVADRFISDFQAAVEEKSYEYGAQKKYSFILPNIYDEVCFIDSMNEDNQYAISPAAITDPFIRSKIENNVKENGFLMKDGEIKRTFYADKLDVDGDFKCFKTTGQISIWLKGVGKKSLLYT